LPEEVVGMRPIGEVLMSAVAVAWSAFWMFALGAIGLWAFFLIFGAFSPTDPIWLTVAMGVLALLAALHFAHVRKAIEEDKELARRTHMIRERRGF
jgi:hypothetical protein